MLCYRLLLFKRLMSMEETKSAEWTNTLQRTMQEVVPGVFLGPYHAAVTSRRDLLLQHRVTHVVCVRHRSEARTAKPNLPGQFQYLVLDIADSAHEDIIRHFPAVKKFVDDCLEAGGSALIHGGNGNSRSAALAIAYVMETRGMAMPEAYRFVENRRHSIRPNRGFIFQLAEYEPICRAKSQRPEPGTRPVALKGPLTSPSLKL